MRQTKKDRYFAMYKGDKYVDGGTIVELAKKYGADESGAFVNGVLAKFA